MHMCMLNYVDHDKVNESLNVVEVCRKIREMKQVKLVNERLTKDTPDELFDWFSEISVILLENAST